MISGYSTKVMNHLASVLTDVKIQQLRVKAEAIDALPRSYLRTCLYTLLLRHSK